MTVMANTKVVTSNFSARSTNSGLSHHFYLRIEFLYLRHYQWGQGKVSQNLLETFNNRPWFSALHNNDFYIKEKSKIKVQSESPSWSHALKIAFNFCKGAKNIEFLEPQSREISK